MLSKQLPTPVITISKSEARRFMLAHHGLWPARSLKGKSGVTNFIQHIGSIQFDPINIVGRNPDLVLQSRIMDYRAVYLDELLYKERSLIDGWDKMACIYATTDWPNFRYRRNFLLDNPDPRKPPETILNETLEHIQKRGPLSSLDFKESEKVDWHWGPTKPIRAAMEYLYSRGILGIHHRINNRRYFDLIENLLQENILHAVDPFVGLEDYQDWHVLRRVGSLGLAQIKTSECWGGIVGVRAKERNESLVRLNKKNHVISLKIKGVTHQIMFIRSIDLPVLKRIINEKTTVAQSALIAPLDNLLWNRSLIEDLFNFRYRWEVYKPKAQREYGYYVLPVLYGDQFVARFDPGFDKKKKILTMQNWWWEPGVQPDEKMRSAILDCLASFCKYLGVEETRFSEPILENPMSVWLRELK